ncbi:MAG: Thiopurine S-methyltransferase [Legionella sp.]|uniref:thiopurine S-methyltransferase n=1 Tax=Legionella sp. TaxID=459 RepID=UPI003D127BC9
MDKEYWHQKWQSQEVGFNQLQANKLMQRYFSSLSLAPGCRVFVPLCGQSIDMLWLVEQDYQVVGIELSQIACSAFFEENKISTKIEETNDFIWYRSDRVSIFAGDFFKLNRSILGKVDAVYDRAALIALPMDVRKSYSKHLIGLMDPAAAMFLITTAYNQNEMQGPPFSVDENEVSALYSAYFDINQLYSKPFETPAHLKDKGLLKATEQVYLLTRKKTGE